MVGGLGAATLSARYVGTTDKVSPFTSRERLETWVVVGPGIECRKGENHPVSGTCRGLRRAADR